MTFETTSVLVVLLPGIPRKVAMPEGLRHRDALQDSSKPVAIKLCKTSKKGVLRLLRAASSRSEGRGVETLRSPTPGVSDRGRGGGGRCFFGFLLRKMTIEMRQQSGGELLLWQMGVL